MRRLVTVMAAVAAVLALTAGSALANPPGITGSLNQNQEDHTGSGGSWDNNFGLGQTFTADVTGTLDAVGVYISAANPPGPKVQPAAVGDTSILIAGVVAGLPTGALLSGVTVNVIGNAAGWVYVELPSPLAITAGTQYGLLIRQGAGGSVVSWAGDCAASTYAGGQAFVFDLLNETTWLPTPSWSLAHGSDPTICQRDYAFETFVTAGATATAPPTSTAAPAQPTSNTPAGAWLIFAGLAAAAAIVTLRRHDFARR